MSPTAASKRTPTAAPYRALEPDALGLSVPARLAGAAARLLKESALGNGTSLPLRAEQARVFSAFGDYLTDLATRPNEAVTPASPFCRIILPPRTGKTVIAGHVINRTGLTATVVVPTRTLVRQTQRLFDGLLPGTPLGVWTGEEKAPVEHGVNLTTYSMLLRAGLVELPMALRRSALVFADEAHHAMTPARMALLREAFDPKAVRIGLTATPDYDGERRLSRFFPDLVHEVSLAEALELDLLAPVRVWVAEVDRDGSVVRMTAGEYEQHTLGRLMSAAPFFKAACQYRYEGGNASRGALLCCATRQQAYDLFRFLQRHGPPGVLNAALILGETPAADREEALARFEAGQIDTLIQVGVLIEGWSSPRCKVLVDLAPSVSRVRATQKYFRAMTRDADAEAYIYVILPKDLPTLPTLPMDLFGGPADEYECGSLIGSRPGTGPRPSIQEHTSTPIAGVRLRQRVLLQAALRRPALRRGDLRGLQRVLASCPDFKPGAPCGRYRFRSLLFGHSLFAGRGQFLLEWLGFASTAEGYEAFLAVACPDAVADRFLADHGMGEHSGCKSWCAEDVEFLESVQGAPGGEKNRLVAEAWRAMGWRGGEPSAPDAWLVASADLRDFDWALAELKPRHLTMLERRFGLSGEVAGTLRELGGEELVSPERIRSVVHLAVLHLKHHLARRAALEKGRLDRASPLAEGCAFASMVYRASEARPSRRVDVWCSAVLENLADAVAPLPPTDIAQHLGLGYQDVAAASKWLMKRGAVRRTSEGYVDASRLAQTSKP